MTPEPQPKRFRGGPLHLLRNLVGRPVLDLLGGLALLLLMGALAFLLAAVGWLGKALVQTPAGTFLFGCLLAAGFGACAWVTVRSWRG